MRFDEALTGFLATHCAVKNRPATARQMERLLRRHFLVVLKGRRLEDIRTGDFAAIIDRILATPSEAQHAFAAGRTFFKWAVRRRYIAHSPTEGLLAPSKSVPRERVLSDVELARVYAASRHVGYPFGTIVELLLLTGQRRTEIGSLRRSFVDEAKNIITLPGSFTKNAREHTFPFGPLATCAVVVALHSGGKEFLFVARNAAEKPFNGWSSCKAAFDRECPIDHWTLHDLRRTFSTIMARIGTAPHITERILNHQVGTLTPIAKIYNRYSYLEEMRAAMLNYEREVARILAIESHSLVASNLG